MIQSRPFEPGDAWALVQAASLLRRLGRLLECAPAAVANLDADIPEGVRIELTAADVSAIETLSAEAADLAGQLQLITDRLGARPTTITHTNLRLDAQQVIAEGPFDPHRLLLAAKALHYERGWRLLAATLRCTDAHKSWEGITVTQLLSTFRDTDSRHTTRVIARARLDPDAEPSALTRAEVTELARALTHNTDDLA